MRRMNLWREFCRTVVQNVHILFVSTTSVRIQLRSCASLLLCSRYLNPSVDISDTHACHPKPYTLFPKTLYPFPQNPIPFSSKPYTLSPGTLYPFARNPIPFRGKRLSLFSDRSSPDGCLPVVCQLVTGCLRARFRRPAHPSPAFLMRFYLKLSKTSLPDYLYYRK